MPANLEDYQQFMLYPNQENLGILSSERFVSDTIRNIYGIVRVHHSDPAYVNGGKGLFERHGLEYPRGVIHVGMWKFEESDDYECLIGQNLIGVEANPYVYEEISNLVAIQHGFKAYNFAAWNADGESLDLYYDPSRMDCSTLFDNSKESSFSVSTKKLDTLVLEENVDATQYNCLNIDAEGAELQVLQGYEDNISNVDYVLIETSLNDRFNSGSDLKILDDYLIERGFEIKEIDSKFANYGWGDAFFVRKK
jgi:hypothetical protein